MYTACFLNFIRQIPEIWRGGGGGGGLAVDHIALELTINSYVDIIIYNMNIDQYLDSTYSCWTDLKDSLNCSYDNLFYR